MKRTALALLTIAVISSIVYAQQQTARKMSNAAIEVGGTKLHLGMTKAQVTEKLAGHEFTKVNEDEWMLGSLKELGPTLQFTHGLLSYADRNWVTYDNDIVEALFGAVRTLNDEGFSVCTVTADDAVSPDLTSHRVWIDCGEKTVLVIRRSFGGKSYNSVDERLGHMRDILGN
jgi:hypothetical protein